MKDYYVLITGSDLTGKTELINRLENSLHYKDYTLKVSKGHLKKTKITDLTEKLMRDNPHPKKDEGIFGINYDFFINSLLTALYLVDALDYKKGNNSTLHLQDSYYERTMAVIAGREIPYLNDFLEKVSDHLFQFDCSILLTATLESRIDRLKKRGGDLMDSIILTNSEEITKIDEYLTQQMNKRANCKIIDTSILSLEEVEKIALSHIYRTLKKGF